MSLQSIRDELKSALDELPYDVFTYVPAGIYPPVILFTEDDPYVEQNDITFNEDSFKVNLKLMLITDETDNESAIDSLNTMITDVISATGGWTASVGAPFIGAANDYEYLTCFVSISSPFTLQD